MRLFGPLSISSFLALTQCLQTILGPGLRVPLLREPDANRITVDGKPTGASGPIPEAFVSFSIEFAFFPDFTSSKAQPNVFSNNLLENIWELSGTKPFIRVGGKTHTSVKGTVVLERSRDYPTILSVGPSYFDSHSIFSNTKYIHGFNLGKNGTTARQSLLATVPLACKALGNGKLLYWEFSNEPDLFKTSAQGAVRPRDWDEQDYVNEWLAGSRAIGNAMRRACPEMASDAAFKWIAPSFAGPDNDLDPVIAWNSGLNRDGIIGQISMHNYIADASKPGVTLAGMLLNHTTTTTSITRQLNTARLLAKPDLPLILGEANSLSNQGAPGLSNTFGAALWSLDFNLYCASQDIKRVFMHQGTDYRYSAWQPISTSKITKGTKPPYYGSIAVAAMLGDLTNGTTQVKHLPLSSETEAAYATYKNDVLHSIMVINIAPYDYTPSAARARPEKKYPFQVPSSCAGIGVVQRLLANWSSAITGVTWNGLSYNYGLQEGKLVLLGNVTEDEITWVGQDGVFNAMCRTLRRRW
ncbi:hypothetical protein H2201_005667 [Coniosporium apollinis]|uniref:Beta-glucuronidase C-terminal domain-containing protein n=1 Tax=Coniosporium apollinis TaxID=61459 RepID=A0ABQ9NQ53_9PEZI|nr:hypothetical protein H2201_005667 [Coniosporium apollinis]